MVAWELGALEEKNGRTEGAVKWYSIAAERFRRAEWRKKAEDALTRLGAEIPAAGADSGAESHEEPSGEAEEQTVAQAQEVFTSPALGEIVETEPGPEATAQPSVDSEGGQGLRKKRRRGHRGGRGRRKRGGAGAPSLPTQAFAKSASSPGPHHETPQRAPIAEAEHHVERRESLRAHPPELPAPQLPSERTAHGRAGDPALASRMARLESMLRRLLSGALHRLDQADEAPAGPGVFLLSDSDQVTSYYVESCQTLRVGLGNLVRGNRSRGHRGASRSFPEIDLKERLADHLGINQSKVAQYMKDHCVVRWIQLDEDAPHLAHFAISVLRTPLNLE